MNLNATLFAQMIVFFILWWVVARFVWPPLVKALDERATKVAEGLAAAERGKIDLANATKKAEEAMASARQEGVQRVAEAEKRGKVSVFALTVNSYVADFFERVGFKPIERESLPAEWRAGYDFSRNSRAFVYPTKVSR